MADYFSSSPNFVNPAYATPEQLATQRAYAAELLKRSGEDTNRPTGALANGLNALTSALMRNNANDLQSQAAQGNASDVSAIISQLQSGQKLDPQTLGHLYANPMASPEARALVGGLIAPKVGEDVAGRPTTISPAGGMQGLPVGPGIQPGIRPGMSTPDASITAVPQPAPPLPGAPQSMVPHAPSPRMDAVSPQGGIFGGMNSRPADWNTAPPVGNAAGGYQGPMTLDQLAEKGREFAAKRAYTQGGAEALTTVAKQDIEGATSAPTIKRVAGVMLDDLAKHGDKMTFGPTSEWSNNVKRIAANYAPGFMKDQLEAVASADSFDKMSAQLTSLLAKGGGTDAQLFNNMKSVPGAHNSKEGAEALLKMTLQVADQQMALRQFTATAKDASQYEAMRSDFYKRNPIINPLTNNPISLDLEKSKSTGGARIISVEPPR